MTRGISRRLLLAATATSIPAALAGLWWLTTSDREGAERLIRSILRRHLARLPVEDSDIDRAVRDIIDGTGASPQRRYKLAALFGPVHEYTNAATRLPVIGEGFSRLEDAVVHHFLMHSDFFRNGKDSGQRVRYLGMGSGACSNPFARLA